MKPNNQYKNHPLSGFFYHGVPRTENVSDNQYISQCPFPDCQREDKFYINTEKKLWDCKVCGRKGNYVQFLEAIAKVNQEFCEKRHLRALAEDRNLPVKAFDGYEIGFDGDKFTFPIRDYSGKFVGLKCYKPGFTLFNTKDTRIELWSAQRLKKRVKEPVYVCEGEWDAIALHWMLRELDKPGVVVGVPSANTFKDEWVEYFYGRNVIALYDNDDAGRKGEIRCFSMLQEVANSLKFISWPQGKPEGYDVRDLIGKFYRKNKLHKCYSLIHNWLQEVPRELINEAKTDADGNLTLNPKKEEKLEPISFSEVIEAFQAYLHMPDITPIKVMLATVLANRVPGDMVWMFLVAPPSSAKTELLTALFQSSEIVSITALTQNTLISGFMGPAKDYSLLPKLKDKVLVIKDFTGVLTMAQQARDAIFGQLRDAYDRRSEKIFGHGVHKIYKDVHFGILAGVTNTIENINIMQQTLGERFLRYYLPFDPKENSVMQTMRKALDNVSKEPEKQITLQMAVKRFLGTFVGTKPVISEDIQNKLIYLSRLIARMRGIVPRDFKGDKILYKPQSEGPMRVGKQLYKMAVALANLEGKPEVTDEEYQIVKQIGLGSCPSRVEAIIKYLYFQSGRPVTYTDVVGAIGFNYATIKSVMEDLLMLNIIQEKGKARKKYYTLSDEASMLIEKGAVYPTPKKRVFVIS